MVSTVNGIKEQMVVSQSNGAAASGGNILAECLMEVEDRLAEGLMEVETEKLMTVIFWVKSSVTWGLRSQRMYPVFD